MESKTVTPPVLANTTEDHTEDIALIEQIIRNVETAYNTNDAELMVADFAADASAVNAAGVLITGREALLEASLRGVAGFLKDQFVRYELADITFLRSDVAIAHKVARAVTASGDPIDIDHSMIALYVLVKKDGRWWTAARQNTLVPAPK